MRGTRDAIVPAWVARRLATLLPCGSLAELEGEVHAVQFNAPEPFTQLALAFLAGSIRDELSLDLDPMDDRRRSPGAVPACLPNDA